MKLHALLSAQILLLLLALSGLVAAESPPLLTSGVEVSASNERTALSRTTRKLASTVDVKIKNTSDRLLEAPVHVVVTFTAQNGGNLAGLTASSLQGGLGVQPYQTFYKDLSVVIGHGLAVGAETTFSFSFERPPEVSVSYAMALRGIRNRDPVAATGGPYAGQQGVPLAFDASASSDPDGDALTFAWDFGDGSTAAGATPQHAFEASGLYTVTLTATDARGAVATRETQVPIAPSGVFALARTRTLDGNGHPLGEVTISQTGPDGSLTLVSDSVSGFASLGGVPGDHSWTFGRSGYLTSYRKSTLLQGQVKVVAFPWLTALNPDRTTLSLLNPTPVKSPGGRVALTMPTGAFEQVQSVAVTELHGQSLPLPLPFGWSPLAAFHLDMAGDSAADIAATVKLLQAVTAAQTLVLARVDTAALNWHAESLLTGTAGDTLAVVLRHPGSYAVVLADTLPAGNPAAAQAGQALPAGTAAAIAAEVTAVGSVNPATSAASLDPAKVTAQATVDFTNASQPLASGAWFLADVAETYDLRDGQAIKTPDYDATFYAYQAPGDADPATATATFPMQPRLLFGPDQLSEAHIKVDVLALNQFGGGVLNQDGGQLSLDGLQVGVPAGALSGPAAAEIRLLSTANLAPFLDGLPPLLAFELNLPTLADGTALSFVLTQKLAANSQFVLARCVSTASASGLQPVLRLHSDSQGKVTSAEPASGPRLPGITGSGQYVVVQIPAPEALITGLVRKIGATLLPGALVRASDEPWLSLTGGAGTFAILAKPGQPNVTGTDPADGNSGQASPTLADANSSANVEIQTVVTGPRVVSTTPADGATKVRTVTPVTVKFSEPLDLASFGPGALTVTAGTEVIVGSLSINAAGTEATFLPANPLAASTLHTLTLAATIRDRQALPLEGTAAFTFTTAAPAARGEGAQLVIYEPDAVNIPAGLVLPGYNPAEKLSRVVAVGGAGTADPEVPVILVNETSGETATIVSKPDGSFANFIKAAVEDFISAVFVNANGTRVTIPATRQNFDDGRVGLYKQGGILEAQSDGGPVQVIVEPSAVADRAVFALQAVGLAELLALANSDLPADAKLLGGFRLSSSTTLTSPVHLSIPVDPTSLNLPSGVAPEQTSFTVAQPDQFDGTPVFNVVDTGTFANGKVTSSASPVTGIFPSDATTASNALVPTANSSSVKSPRSVQKNALMAPQLVPHAIMLGMDPSFMPFFIFNIPKSFAIVTGVVITASDGTTPDDIKGSKATDGFHTKPPKFFPVAGAMVFAGSRETLTGFNRGAFAARTGPFGGYSMQVPIEGASDAVGLRALSLLFPGKAALGVAVSGGFATYLTGEIRTANLAFLRPPTKDTSAPYATLETGHPFLPVSETGAATASLFYVDLVDDKSDPDLLDFRWANFTPGNPSDPDISRELVDGDPHSPGAPLTEENIELAESSRLKRGGHQLRIFYKITVKKPSLVYFKAVTIDQSGNTRNFTFPVFFLKEAPPVPQDPILASDTTDTVRPVVSSVYPGQGAVVVDGDEVLVHFSKAINKSANGSGKIIAVGSISGALPAVLDLTPDQVSGRIKISGARPGDEVTLIFTSSITDLNGNALVPLTESYTITKTLTKDFTTEGSVVAVADVGSRSIVLERTADGNGQLSIFKQGSDLSTNVAAGKLGLPSYPRVLDVIESYSFCRRPGSPVEKKSLAVIAGGLLGADYDGFSDGAWLWVVDISDPAHPARLASAVTDIDFAAATTKLKISNGDIYMGVQSPEGSFIQVINLQSFILGSSLTPEERVAPHAVTFGTDLNNDGDFVDAGEQLPKVALRGLAGFKFSIPLAPSMVLNDFDVDASKGTLVVVLRGANPDTRSRFQMVLHLGESIGTGDASDPGGIQFLAGENPLRVMLDRDVVVSSPDGPKLISLAAIVVCNNQLLIYDLETNPLVPRRVDSVRLPSDSGSLLHLGRVGDNYLASSGSMTYVVSRSKLVDNGLKAAAGAMSPAVIASLPVGSVGRNLGATKFEVTGMSGGKLRRLILPPPISILRIARSDPSATFVPVQDVLGLSLCSSEVVNGILKQGSVQSYLTPARLDDLGPKFPGALAQIPPPERHYYVRVETSGVSGRIIKLGVDATDLSGHRLAPHGLIHAPVILTDNIASAEVDANRQPKVTAPLAYRLSDNEDDPLYNIYLSEPFVLTGDAYSSEIGTRLHSIPGRQAIQVGSFLRVAIEAADNAGILGDLLTPNPKKTPDAPTGMSRSFPSFCGDFLDSPNPGSTEATLSQGGVQIQSGEFHHTAVDLLVETPGQPIELARTYESGTHAATGFGRGWDFEFNMRLCEVPMGFVPDDFELPLVVYPTAADNVVATPGDVMMQTGGSDLVLFRLISPGHGNERLRGLMQADPAIAQFGWTGKVSAFYEPPRGSFDLLVKLSDGVFVLVDTTGRRTYYRADGLVEKIVFPYEASKISMTYRADGRIDRVTGDGGAVVKFGYYQFPNSKSYQLGQDIESDLPTQAGLIAQVLTGDDKVRYYYDDTGSLIKVEGLTANTVYGYDTHPPHQLTSISRDDGGKPPGQKIFYKDGVVNAVEIDGQRTEFSGAATTASDRATSGGAAPVVKSAGGPGRSYPTDANGHPTEIAGKQVAIAKDGLLKSFGSLANGFETVYDETNPVYRFRSNVIAIKQGGVSQMTASFDNSAWNRTLTEVDGQGVTTSYNYGAASSPPGEVKVTVGSKEQVSKFNPFGILTAETTSEGGVDFSRVVTFDNDGLPSGTTVGNLLSSGITRGAKHGVESITQGSKVARSTFSDSGQLSGISTGDMNLTVAHDPSSGRPSSTKVAKGERSISRDFTYSKQQPGRFDQVVASETGLPDQTVKYTYDSIGRTQSTTRNGVTTNLAYDGLRVSSLREPGLARSLTFDPLGRPKKVTEQGIETEFTYNAQGRTQTMSAQGATHTYIYGTGDQVQMHKVEDAVGTDLTEEFTYDSVGRVRTARTDGVELSYDYFPDNSTKQVRIDGFVCNEIEKNEAGLATRISILNGALATSFDNFDSNSGLPGLITTTLLDGTAIARTVIYDDSGRPASTLDPGGISSSVEYDDFGNRCKETDADGVVTQRTFTPTGMPLTQTFGDGTTVSYSYNDDLTTHSKGDVRYSYDAELLPSKAEYPDGTMDEYLARNAFMLPEQVKLGSNSHQLVYTDGRLTQLSATTGDELINFTYDGLGRTKEIARNDYFLKYTYSHQAGVISEQTPLGTWSVEADSRARISTEHYPSGWLHTFAPDEAGLPTAVTELGIDKIEWRDLELPKRVHFVDGREIRWSFDAVSRVTGIEYINANGIVAAFDYALTPGGRVLAETRRHENATDVYIHNEASAGMRIKGVLFSATGLQSTGSAESLTGISYDANGEIDWSQVASTGGGPRGIKPAAGDTLVNNDQGSAADGPIWVNINGMPQKFHAHFMYDAFGYLEQVQRIEAGNVTVAVVYRRDGNGRIVAKTVTGPATKCLPGEWRYAWKGDHLIEEYQVVTGQSTPQLLTRYIYLNDTLAVVQRNITGVGLKNFIPLCGLNGSIEGFLDDAGAIAEFTRFGLYGMPEHIGLVSGVSTARSNIAGLLQFQGAFFDEETGLYFMGTRTLHPVFGRFLERDTTFYTDSRAFYTAFNGDPATYVDPCGTEPVFKDSRKPTARELFWNWEESTTGGGMKWKPSLPVGKKIGGTKSFQWSMERTSKAFSGASKIIKAAAGLFPSEYQAAFSNVADAVDLVKHSLRLGEEIHDFAKNRNAFLSAKVALDRVVGIGALKMVRFQLAQSGVPALGRSFGTDIRKAKEDLAMTRNDHYGSFLAFADVTIGFAKIILKHTYDPDTDESARTKTGYALKGGIELADSVSTLAGSLLGEAIARTQMGLRVGDIGLESQVFRRSSLCGGFLDLPASSILAKGIAIQGMYAAGYAAGKGLITLLYGIADPGAAQAYRDTAKMFENDGGLFGFRTAGAVMQWAGLVSAAAKLNDLADFSIMDTIEKRMVNPSEELYYEYINQ